MKEFDDIDSFLSTRSQSNHEVDGEGNCDISLDDGKLVATKLYEGVTMTEITRINFMRSNMRDRMC
jgi:hypothetical protein